MKFFWPCALVVTYVFLSGCETTPPPASALKQSEWQLEADFATKSPKVLLRGESRASVVEKLGVPERKDRMKSDPEVEILTYRRTIEGPLVQRYWKTDRGTMSVRKPQMFIDEIMVYLRKDSIEAVVVNRRLEADALGRSFMQ